MLELCDLLFALWVFRDACWKGVVGYASCFLVCTVRVACMADRKSNLILVVRFYSWAVVVLFIGESGFELEMYWAIIL